MRPEVRKLVEDMQKACGLIVRFTAGKSLTDYSQDDMLRSAVERQFEIVGEALSQASKLDPGLTIAISDTRSIIDFRNILAHGYSVVKHDTVWGIVQGNLPVLIKEIDQLLNQP
jgi:uncharacterized protein with HEPN domain